MVVNTEVSLSCDVAAATGVPRSSGTASPPRTTQGPSLVLLAEAMRASQARLQDAASSGVKKGGQELTV